jgi:F0F1-type ATP synthase epsilon subunit
VADAGLEIVVLTPREVVVRLAVLSLRVPTDSGQVGLRHAAEPSVLAVEPGLALATTSGGVRFLATAGGLLRCDGRRAVLLTPIAVVGDDAGSVRRRLDEALAAPSSELALRRAIERLEAGILRELRGGSGAGAGRAGAAR